MLIKNGNYQIRINNDGSIRILDKNYIDKENNLKDIEHYLKPLLDNNQSINYLSIPFNIRIKINKSLNNVFNSLEENEEGIFALNFLNNYGILREKKDILSNSRLKINSSLFKLGLNDLDKFYFKNKKAKLEFIDSFENRIYDKSVNENIFKFINYYKTNKLNNFKLFHDALKDYGIKDLSEILKHYNDGIDNNFSLSSKEFGLISLVKRDLIELQNKVIEDAIEEGLDIPLDLPRFTSPTNKIKMEIIDDEKIDKINNLNFGNIESSLFVDNKPIKELQKKIIEEIKFQEKIIDIDTNDNIKLIQLQLINNGGFSFSKMKDWVFNKNSNILSPNRMVNIAQSSIKYCNKLVECGILKTDNYEDFYFSCPKTREILLKNSDLSFNELANIVLDEFSSEKNISTDNKNSKKVTKNYKKDIFDFLEAEYNSFYKPNNKTVLDFIEDIKNDKTIIKKRINELYPLLQNELFDLINEYEDLKKYTFVRNNSFVFDKNNLKEVDSKWKEIRGINRSFSKINDDSPEILKEKNDVTIKFINLSCVKFGNIKLDNLQNWKENSIKNGLDIKIADGFVYKSIQQAKDLVSIGILKTKDNKNFFFKDDFAREILFKNFDKNIDNLKELNKGIKTLIKYSTFPEIDDKNDLILKLKNFNMHYKNSSNEKFIKDMEIKEKSLFGEIENKYVFDNNFRKELTSYYLNETIEPIKHNKLSLIINNSNLNTINVENLSNELKV